MNSTELARELERGRAELKSIFDAHKTDGKLTIPADKVEEIEKRNAELAELNTKYLAAKSLEETERENEEALKSFNHVARLSVGAPAADSTKSIGELIVDSGALKHMHQPIHLGDVSLKTLMSTGAGFAPFNPRDNVVAGIATRPLSLLDVIPQMEWPHASYKFMEETTFTNNSAEIAESVQGTLSAYPESALAYTERTVDMRKVATFLPVSDEQLEDVPGMVEYLNARLAFMVKQRYEAQLIAGNGVAPNVTGMLNVSGIQSQAKGADSVPDAIYKAITKVRAVGFAEPTHILLHPNDFQDIRILQNTTGQYVFEGGLNFAGTPQLFGIPVILSTAVTENTGLVVDMSYVSAVNRRGVDVQLGYIGDDFKNGVKSVRADLRGNLACYRGTALCKVTGI